MIPQVPMWLAAAAGVAVPWVIGGSSPSRGQLTVAILLLGVFAFASSASLVLSTFDISRLESFTAPSEAAVLSDRGIEGFNAQEADAPLSQAAGTRGGRPSISALEG